MQFLLDHLSAALVGGVVILILGVIGIRAGESTTGAQIYESSRRYNQAFAQQLEGDLLNVGYGVPAATDPLLEWTDSTFRFLRRIDTLAASPVAEVTYRRATVGAVEIDGAAVPLYRVDRFVDGVRTGGSPPTLSAYRLALVTRSGAETADLDAALGVRVAFRTSFGTTGDDHVGSASRFERTFYPANLD